LRTQDILYLALRKGEITSEEIIKELIGEVKNRGDYRKFLAQASTLLRRLHKRGMLERKWVREHRGQYVYSPSEKIIGSLLPALGVLEERKRRKEIEEALTEFAKEIILKLRMEDIVKGILWNPSEYKDTEEGLRAGAWIAMSDMKNRGIIERKAKENRRIVKIDPVFITPTQLSALENLDSMKILYGWDFVASTKQRIKRKRKGPKLSGIDR